MSSAQEEAFSFVSEMEPPPRISRYPAPFYFPDKPVPMVPDVSLIVDKEAATPTSTQRQIATPTQRQIATPTQRQVATSPVPPTTPDPSLAEFGKELKEQKEALMRVETKIDKILSLLLHQSVVSTQTPSHSTPAAPIRPTPTPATAFPNIPPTSRTSTPTAPQPPTNNRQQQILKEVELPPLPSGVYSEASGIKSLHLEEFHDDSFQSGSDSPVLGASASAYCCSDEDDDPPPVGKPSTTFYNNVLGNVNRLLDGGSQQSSRNNSSNRERKENRDPLPPPLAPPAKSKSNSSGSAEDEVVMKTKSYLKTLGVQFNSPPPPPTKSTPMSRKNYMIQQNVYNSIYIPTVNYPGNSMMEGNSNVPSGIHPPEDLRVEGMRGTETTLYGMSQNNLSFATKEYLQRYGLVTKPKQDRILNITAIKNQPKLL